MVNRWDLLDKNRNEASTPEWLYRLLERMFGAFDLDVAATPANSKCKGFLGDAMAQPWLAANAYGFPPPNEMSRNSYIKRAREQVEAGLCSQAVILYAAADPTTSSFRKILQSASEVYLVAPRLRLYSILGDIFEMRASIAVFRKGHERGLIKYLHLPTALEIQGLDYGHRATLFSKVESKQRVLEALSSATRRGQEDTEQPSISTSE